MSNTSQSKPTIVLVHGAFADASGWAKVITGLDADGYTVVAVQNPLASYADDVATTRRMIDAQRGPVVVVGHSYGGAVITGAATGASNVKALVYLAALAPDENESLGPLFADYPSPALTAFVPDTAGFLYIDPTKFTEIFAGDATATEQLVLRVTQKPLKSDILGQVFGKPAWREIPSWFLVSQKDNVINPDLQRLFAKRM